MNGVMDRMDVEWKRAIGCSIDASAADEAAHPIVGKPKRLYNRRKKSEKTATVTQLRSDAVPLPGIYDELGITASDASERKMSTPSASGAKVNPPKQVKDSKQTKKQNREPFDLCS